MKPNWLHSIDYRRALVQVEEIRRLGYANVTEQAEHFANSGAWAELDTLLDVATRHKEAGHEGK